MKAHRIETTLTTKGVLTLQNLPFDAGANVEVIVLERADEASSAPTYPLRGTVARYDDPFEPAVPIEDWEALK